MPTPLHTPRVNNNDDVVKLLRVFVKTGAPIVAGDIVAEVETDKATFAIEADRSGFVLAVVPKIDDTIAVGSVLMWVGTTPDEAIPQNLASDGEAAASVPTINATQLLTQYGLSAADVPAPAGRLRASDVEAYVASRGVNTSEGDARGSDRLSAPTVSGRLEPLAPHEISMLRTVLWQRQEAVPAYVELQFDSAAWERAAAEYQQQERLLLSPLLAMMCHRLVTVAREHPRLNSTIVGDQRFIYQTVNLGFTVQSESTLYLVVVEDAASLGLREFVGRIGQLQRNALTHRLHPRESTGATVAFSSMARWNASRHVPVLPPRTAFIVAHAAASSDGRSTLGATYDHRVLNGFEALSALVAIANPGNRP